MLSNLHYILNSLRYEASKMGREFFSHPVKYYIYLPLKDQTPREKCKKALIMPGKEFESTNA